MSEQTVFDSKEFRAIAKKTSKRGKRVNRKEERIQTAVSKYIKIKYPKVIFNSDIASGIKLPIWLAGMAKAQRSSRGQPDLVIYEPRRGFHALCIELKKDRESVFKLDGGLKKDKHLEEQAEILKRLADKGYHAVFGCGFDHCREIIDWYLGE